MLEERALVVDATETQLWLETQPRSSCSTCSSSGCTTSVISKLFGIQRNRLEVENSLNATSGDWVVIGIPDELVAVASVWAYLFPLIVMFIATVMGILFGVSQAVQALLAIVGLIAGFVMTYWQTNSRSRRGRYSPTLLRIAEPNASQSISIDEFASFPLPGKD